MQPQNNSSFCLLVVLDGWGIAPSGPGNAITQSNTPNMTSFWASYPHTQLGASSESVGLPRGEVGNTETGHLNLGAGRIIYQDLARINMAIADGSFFDDPALNHAFDHAIKNNSKLHLIGLVGAGGVHSNLEHLFALIQLAARRKLKEVYIHGFTDGRDSPPTAASTYIKQIRDVIKKEGVGQIASIMGRYWAMDRDQRWDRTAKAYCALTNGDGNLVKTPEEAIEDSYAKGQTDEFIEPSLISENGKPIALIEDNDAVVFFNFRIDRPRQLTKAFVFGDFVKAKNKPGFDPYTVKYTKKHSIDNFPTQEIFPRGEALKNLFFVTMTEYEKSIVEAGAKVAFPPEVVEMPLGGVLSTHEKKQLRVAESEKERFVTFYFNGLREIPFYGEDRLVVPSPKVATYDLKPEMSAEQMTELLMTKMHTGEYDFILINYANVDMVGHTGNIGAAIKAIETVDKCLGKLSNFVLATEGTMFITADHGNAEEMIKAQTGQVDTEHSAYPVPFIAVSRQFIGKSISLSQGILADVAPTVLAQMELEVPTSMMGRDLLKDLRES